jgi:hypothetical protein
MISNDVKNVIDVLNNKDNKQIKVNKLNKIFQQDPKLANQIGVIINKYSAAYQKAKSQGQRV